MERFYNMKMNTNNKTKKIFNCITYLIIAGVIFTCIAVPIISILEKNNSEESTPVTVITDTDELVGNKDNADNSTTTSENPDSNAGADDQTKTLDQYEETGTDNEISFDMFE